jgi:hypothetical protein
MGVLFAYGATPTSCSVGGFHPQFNPPTVPPRPSVSRFINESFARIHADGYRAVTTTSLERIQTSSSASGMFCLRLVGSMR